MLPARRGHRLRFHRSPLTADALLLQMELHTASETGVQSLCTSLQKLQKPNYSSVSRGC